MLDLREMAAMGDRRRFALDARFEIAVDGLDEILAMEARMEAEDRAAEQAVEQLLAPGADAERLGVRPRNVPEGDDRGLGQPLVNQPRQQRNMIILHEH